MIINIYVWEQNIRRIFVLPSSCPLIDGCCSSWVVLTKFEFISGITSFQKKKIQNFVISYFAIMIFTEMFFNWSMLNHSGVQRCRRIPNIKIDDRITSILAVRIFIYMKLRKLRLIQVIFDISQFFCPVEYNKFHLFTICRLHGCVYYILNYISFLFVIWVHLIPVI